MIKKKKRKQTRILAERVIVIDLSNRFLSIRKKYIINFISIIKGIFITFIIAR